MVGFDFENCILSASPCLQNKCGIISNIQLARGMDGRVSIYVDKLIIDGLEGTWKYDISKYFVVLSSDKRSFYTYFMSRFYIFNLIWYLFVLLENITCWLIFKYFLCRIYAISVIQIIIFLLIVDELVYFIMAAPWELEVNGYKCTLLQNSCGHLCIDCLESDNRLLVWWN